VRLDGIHHITAITGDAARNCTFYARALGLRLVKKTVNHDQPDVYHLYYADEAGHPGSILSFFEFPRASRGRAGAGMVHRITWRVASRAAVDFWAERLAQEGVDAEHAGDRLRFRDYEGLALEIAAVTTEEPPLAANAARIPPEHALQGFDGVRVYADDAATSERFVTDALAFEPTGPGGFRVGDHRSAAYRYDPAPAERGVVGAGAVHHVAWTSADGDLEQWRTRALSAGARPSGILDRTYFRSVYFREPCGALFEIATSRPGFAVDEPPDRLGQSLALPPQHEPRRAELEARLAPVANPRDLAVPA
jgi:glyoxalase family protein